MNLASISNSQFQRPDPAAMRAKMFKESDADGSGGISKAELSAMLEKAPKPPEGGAGPANMPDAEELFSTIDTDGNGEISETENSTFMEQRDEEMKVSRPRPEGFAGSTDLMQSLLDALKKDNGEEGGSTTTPSGTSSTDSTGDSQRQKLIQSLLEQLNKANARYTQSGASQTSVTLSLFSTSA